MFKRRRKEVSVHIFQKRCIGCEDCVEVCRRKVLGMFYKDDYSYATVEFPDKCTGCGRCIAACPVYAIELMKENDEKIFCI